ncbi:MAG: Rieske (2Fe-2S) protein [Gammaproteobacteria bacterium]
MTSTFVLDTKEVEEGATKPVIIAGLRLLVCHSKGEFYVIQNQCSHAKARLKGGKLRGCRIFCPLHSAAFDMRTGEALSAPATGPIDVYAVHIDNGSLYIDLPEGV